MAIECAWMEKTLTNSGPLRTLADKHSIYPRKARRAGCPALCNTTPGLTSAVSCLILPLIHALHVQSRPALAHIMA